MEIYPVYVEWRDAVEPLTDFMLVYLDTLQDLRPAYDARGPIGPGVTAHVVFVAYRASMASDPRVQQAIADACRRHGPAPARLVLVACGLSSTPATVPDPTGCTQHVTFDAVQAEDLADRVKNEVTATAQQLHVMGIPVVHAGNSYTPPPLPSLLDQNWSGPGWML